MILRFFKFLEGKGIDTKKIEKLNMDWMQIIKHIILQ